MLLMTSDIDGSRQSPANFIGYRQYITIPFCVFAIANLLLILIFNVF